MVIRRIREHVTAHNWFAVGIDVIIVVIGVFLGTQANNWNNARVASEEGRSYRARLIADLLTNEADLHARQVYYSGVRRHALAALDMLEGRSAPADEQFLIDSYQATHIMGRTLKRFSFDEMIAAGGIDHIGDAQLRERVSNYYTALQIYDVSFRTTPPFPAHLREVMPYNVQQRVRSRCRQIIGEDAAGRGTATLPESCSLGLDPATLAKGASQVRAEPGLGRDLTGYLTDLELKLDSFNSLEARAKRLRKLLEAQAS